MATMKDVAAAAGVTVTTVSRVLNNRGYISEETRKKVFRAMEELQYKPNELARSLSKQTSSTIGVIVPHILHPYFAKMISCIESEASSLGYKILLCNSKADTQRELEYIDMCRANRVCGIVLCSANVDVEKLRDLNLPLITIERNEDVATGGIDCDNYHGGTLATEHLIARGCKHLLHFSGLTGVDMPADDRARGFVDVCRRAGVTHQVIFSEPMDYYNLEYADFVLQTIQQHPKVDGIFASSDVLAAQVIQSCAKLGISIPKQLKLVGFDDVNIAGLCTPPLTTVHQPVEEMAAAAVQYIRQANEGRAVPLRTVLPVQLVIREST